MADYHSADRLKGPLCLEKLSDLNVDFNKMMATALATVLLTGFAVLARAQVSNGDESGNRTNSVRDALDPDQVTTVTSGPGVLQNNTEAVLVTASPKAGESLFLFEFTGVEILDIAMPIIPFVESNNGSTLLPMQLLVNPEQYDAVVVRLLDKVTTRLETRMLPLRSELTFGSLTLMAEICLKNPTDQTPEATSFLRITDQASTEDVQERFAGWMFASSPALNALDHAIYDVWVIDCQNLPSRSSEDS